ncbi:MAG TPA: fibrobacter succinogenes major paralogous domain-containing protein, partial [Prolixibacteraceae bacterium]|nr:fibrobacter succinogenes major paralogous domain-containing protein [Prolixibacteraceae bacterium]
GTITSDGGAMITDQGVCWSTNPNPTVADNKTSKDFNSRTKFQSELNGLFPTTTYYVRAYAKNSAGIAYGNELSFTTSEISPIIFNTGLTYGSVTDIDGNKYKTIRIGTQVWMAENLKTTRYNNGSPIPNVTGDTEWKNLVSGGYCWYNTDPSNFKDTYGALYNWYAVIDNSKICPTGWKVPNSAEWKILASNLGGEGVAGGKMKETGTAHWISPNGGASNESGFTGLPGGGRYTGTTSRFLTLGSYGTWWSSTSSYQGGLGADYFSTDSYSSVGYLSDDWQAFKSSGLSVRCLKE